MELTFNSLAVVYKGTLFVFKSVWFLLNLLQLLKLPYSIHLAISGQSAAVNSFRGKAM